MVLLEFVESKSFAFDYDSCNHFLDNIAHKNFDA